MLIKKGLLIFGFLEIWLVYHEIFKYYNENIYFQIIQFSFSKFIISYNKIFN